MASMKYKNVYIESYSTIVGPYEKNGAIKKYDKNIKLYPGHGDETSLGYEIENNIYMKGDFYE